MTPMSLIIPFGLIALWIIASWFWNRKEVKPPGKKTPVVPLDYWEEKIS